MGRQAVVDTVVTSIVTSTMQLSYTVIDQIQGLTLNCTDIIQDAREHQKACLEDFQGTDIAAAEAVCGAFNISCEAGEVAFGQNINVSLQTEQVSEVSEKISLNIKSTLASTLKKENGLRQLGKSTSSDITKLGNVVTRVMQANLQSIYTGLAQKQIIVVKSGVLSVATLSQVNNVVGETLQRDKEYVEISHIVLADITSEIVTESVFGGEIWSIAKIIIFCLFFIFLMVLIVRSVFILRKKI
jgi:hypothetical protein